MIEKIGNNQPLIKPEPSPRQPDSASLGEAEPRRAAPAGNNGEDASLQADYASFIDKAIQTPQTDAKAVQQAQKLLSSGQLESPKNIRTAVENIIEFGI